MQLSHQHETVRAGAGGGPGEPELAAALRARGLRLTAQREKVLDAVQALGHATPEQLSDAIEGVDVATIYRTLELLEQLGLVKHTHLGHGAPSYRPAADEHIHLVCHACGSVSDAAPELVDTLQRQLREARGFVLDRAHFTVFGRCAACAASADQPSASGALPPRVARNSAPLDTRTRHSAEVSR
jgi:Fur family ferric uptake transcriptional regulator